MNKRTEPMKLWKKSNKILIVRVINKEDMTRKKILLSWVQDKLVAKERQLMIKNLIKKRSTKKTSPHITRTALQAFLKRNKVSCRKSLKRKNLIQVPSKRVMLFMVALVLLPLDKTIMILLTLKGEFLTLIDKSTKLIAKSSN